MLYRVHLAMNVVRNHNFSLVIAQVVINPTTIRSRSPRSPQFGWNICWHDIYRIKDMFFSILSLSGPWSGETDRVSQMMLLIKTVAKTNSPLFCLSVIYIQKSLKHRKKYVCSHRKDFGSKLYLFPCKNYSFSALLF